MNSSGTSSRSTMSVRVLIPLPLSGPYDYEVPGSIQVQPGDFVRVPLGNRVVRGVVWEDDGREDGKSRKLKKIIEKIDSPPLSRELRHLINWVSAYTLAPLGSVLRMSMPVDRANAPKRLRKVYRLASHRPKRLSTARRRVLELLEDQKPRTLSDIVAGADVSSQVVRGLADAGSLVMESSPIKPLYRRPDPESIEVLLTPEQQIAAKKLSDFVTEKKFVAVVLDGVTGSGKTEVYFEALAQALRCGRQCLVMLPEIALTAQWLARFKRRFGVSPVVWHSDISRSERQHAWRAVALGEVAVVVGARSSLFLPFCDLGLVVVDEEHDPSYKQQDGVLYNARDMAIVRADIEQVPAVLVSATPSLETVVNVQCSRYTQFLLPSRYGSAEMPNISLVDLRQNSASRGRWISPPLQQAIESRLLAGEQTLLFLNRRGYAPLSLCRNCGYRIQCPHCSTWLVKHQHKMSLQCHQCGHATPVLSECSACGALDSFAAVGPGVERLSDEVSVLFPEARQIIMSSDTLTGPAVIAKAFAEIAEKRIDLIIGTQVVAKGHHFPHLTLVGVIDADLGLAGGDLRAGERTFQLLSQVTGRAGREERKGHALLQTYFPDHPVMQAMVTGQRKTFIASELDTRRQHGMPPFGRLAAVIVSAEDEYSAKRVAQELGKSAPRVEGATVLGPAVAPLALLRGRYRQRLLVKMSRGMDMQAFVQDWCMRIRTPRNVKVQIDIDPYSFL